MPWFFENTDDKLSYDDHALENEIGVLIVDYKSGLAEHTK